MKKFLVFLAFLTAAVPAWSAPLKIVALVNNEIISSEDFQNRVNAFLMTYEMTYEQEKMIPMNNRKSMVEGIVSQMHGQDYPSNLSEEEYTWFMHGVDSYQKSTIQDIKKRTIK